MIWKPEQKYEQILESEAGPIRKPWQGRLSVAAVYPNTYHVGMSNLGFQTVYRLLNKLDSVVCERSFLPDKSLHRAGRILSLESKRPLNDFGIIAFSISFENDYPHILEILEQAALPLNSNKRGAPHHPLVIAGGVACFLNPEPIAPFIDCFLIGEAEILLPEFIDIFDPGMDKKACLKRLAQNIAGVYVPSFYRPAFKKDGTLSTFKPLESVPEKIQRRFLDDLSKAPTCSAILTPNTTFGQTFLIEVGRGCPHGCRFCGAGYVYRPPRFTPLSILEKCMDQGEILSKKIGLVGTAVSDLPDLSQLCLTAHHKDIVLSFSSLRADALTPELISALRRSKVKTATIAPDAGSERMRKVINKGLVEEDILSAAESLVSGGIPNLKLYFMVGLPTETDDDVEAIVTLCKKIKHRFLKSSKAQKHIGEITVSLNSFVPKPSTPFQWVAMADVSTLKKKIRQVRNGLKRVANVTLHADIPGWAHLQGLFSRGDRRVADILLLANKNQGNWAKTLKESPRNPDFYTYRERSPDERLPWDFIDHGISKSFLWREYKKALQAKTSAPCRLVPCHECRVCMETE